MSTKKNIYLVKQVPFLLELPEQALLGNLTKQYVKLQQHNDNE